VTAGEVVEHDDVPAGGEIGFSDVRANEARAAGDQNPAAHSGRLIRREAPADGCAAI
jgi:hypothetical protein